MLWFIQKGKHFPTLIQMIKFSLPFPRTEQLLPSPYYILKWYNLLWLLLRNIVPDILLAIHEVHL